MTKNPLIDTIKANLKKLFSTTYQFSDFVLTDGTKITTEGNELTVGGTVYCVDEKGNQTPIDDGDYVLNDGRTITVVANAITEIAGEASTEDETPVSDANTANVEEKMADGLAETPSDEGDLASRVADLEAHLEEILKMLSDMSGAQNSTNEQMMSKISALDDEPGAAAIKPHKQGFSGYESYSPKKINEKKNIEEILELRNIISKNRQSNNNFK